MATLMVDGKLITDGSDCYIIAEMGHNHQGDMEKAKRLIKTAKECGVDAVKLQKRDNRTLYTHALYNSPYDNEQSFGATYGEHREFLEFGKDQYRELLEFAREVGVTLFATAFDIPSADFLYELGMPAFKIASGDLCNTPLLRYVASFGKPIFLSTGGGSLADVERAYDTIMPVNPQLCILQCTAAYPADPEDLNLRVIDTYRRRFPEVVVGLSDHENGIDLASVAYMLGARVIEKHFTINHAWRGTDHAYSLEPIGLRKLVRNLRRIPFALGDGAKRPLPCEAKPIYKMSKKLVAARDLPAGHILTNSDVAMKSPGDGLPPYELDNVLGRAITIYLREDDAIRLEILA